MKWSLKASSESPTQRGTPKKNIITLKIIMALSNLFSVIFPDYCSGCGLALNNEEKFLCLCCRSRLVEADIGQERDNKIVKQLYGQCDLFCATSLFYFHKNDVIQQLIHQLKYKGKEEIGLWLGRWLGEKVKSVQVFQQTDAVIPVPLHKTKLKKRGYNQVTFFAKELARILQAEYLDDVLIKTKVNSTQTKKSSWRRFEDSKNIFSVQNLEKISGKNILLVDDLITTGATIESCYSQLVKAKNVRIGVASMAYALLHN